ncbi:MAG: glycosyltransferase [Thermoplasmata archaeon]
MTQAAALKAGSLSAGRNPGADHVALRESAGGRSGLRLLAVSPHLQSFVRDQLDTFLPEAERVEAMVLRPNLSLFDRHRTSVIGRGRDLAIARSVYRSPLLSVRWPRPAYRYCRAVSEIRRAIQKMRATIIHAHFLYPAGVTAAKAARDLRVPCVATGHGFDVYNLPFRNQAWRDEILACARACAAIVAVSKANADCLVQIGVPESSIRVIPNGYDPSIFHPGDRAEARSRLGLPIDGKILLSVGHLVSVKGFDMILSAVSKVSNPVWLVIAGRGPQYRALVSLAEKLGLRGRVRFVGEIPHTLVAEYIRAADVLVIGSRSEGNPTVLVEALGCGRPVVATRVGGIPEVLTSETGILTTPGDIQGLAEGVEQALTRPWSQESLLTTAAQYQWQRLGKRVLNVYTEAMETGAAT